MLIADGGGGYGGTHWMAKEVPAMWAAIANQDTETHYQVVGGWSKTADLTLAHLAQVRVYRDNLASVWPPSKSPAAAAYIARLDKLMADLQATHDAASANYTAFSTVTLTLSLARSKLKPILDQYETNRQLNMDWQAQKDAAPATTPKVAGTPSPSPSPAPIAPVPPVSAARQEELNNQARVIMYDLSSTVLSGQAALQKPKPYKPGGEDRNDEGDGQRIDGGAGSFATPPIIPPPGGGGSGSAGGSVGPGSSSHVSPVSPATHTPVGSTPNLGGGGGGTGPILGGIANPPVITPPNPGLPTPGPTPAPVPSAVGPVPGLIGTPGASGLLPPNGLQPNGTRPPQPGLVKPGLSTGGGRMTMPSGGVIGASPGSGMIGQMPTGTSGGRAPGAGRVNPVGGVIGQPSGTPSGRGTAPVHGQPGPISGGQGRARGRRQEGEQERWDPDNPWSTEEGVDPVVLPPDDYGPIDPGPAIGYPR